LEVIRFALRVLGLDERRAEGTQCLDSGGIPFLLDLTAAADETKVFLQLGPAIPPPPPPTPPSAASPVIDLTLSQPSQDFNDTAAASTTGAGAGSGPMFNSVVPTPSNPDDDNSPCWTWQPSVLGLLSHTYVRLSNGNLKYTTASGGERLGAVPRGVFSMPLVPSSCKFTSGVHTFTLEWKNAASYSGAGVLTEKECAAVTGADFGSNFTVAPKVDVGSVSGGRTTYRLDMDAHKLTTVCGGRTKTEDVPAVPLYFAVTMKFNMSNTSVEIIH
jgi:hypothetical protein